MGWSVIEAPTLDEAAREGHCASLFLGGAVENYSPLVQHFPALPEGQFNGSVHRRKRGLNRFSMTNGKTRRFHVTEFPSALGGQFAIPGEDPWKWKIEFEGAGGNHPSLGCKRIAGQQGTIPDIQVRHVARRVSGGGDSLQRADTIAIVEATFRARFHTWETK